MKQLLTRVGVQRRQSALLATAQVDHSAVDLRSTSVGTITTRRASLSRSAVREIAAEQDVSMALSAALHVRAGGDALVTGGAAGLLMADGDARLEGSSVGVLVSQHAKVEAGGIGLLITPDAQIGDGVRVFIHAREALIFGAALGVCYPVVRYLLQRFAPPPPTQADDERPWYVRASFSLAWAIVRIGVLVLGGWLAYRAVRGRIEQLLPFLGKA